VGEGAVIEQWAVQRAAVDEQKGDQEAADPAVPIEERVDRLELNVGEAAVDE